MGLITEVATQRYFLGRENQQLVLKLPLMIRGKSVSQKTSVASDLEASHWTRFQLYT